MDKKELKNKIYSKIEELPTLPSAVPRLLSLMEQENTDTHMITGTISKDPALASKILKVANSAYYGFPQGIDNLDRAVALLGFNMVKSLAVSLGVMRSMSIHEGSVSFSHKDLWFHSVTVSTALKELCKRCGRHENYEYLFIAGLLHDIGMIVFDQFFGDLFRHALEEVNTNHNLELHIAEKKIIGADHGEVGEILLNRWKFPGSISNPIGIHHHDIDKEGEGAQDVALLRIADVLSHELDMKRGNKRVCPVLRKEDIQVAGINQDELRDIKLYLNEQEESINAFFNAML